MPRTKQFDEQKVLKKAMELFWEKGFHATSIQDLVTHLGINRASLYDTFGGKETLFNRAFSLYRNTNGELVRTLFESESSVKQGFRKLFGLAIEESENESNHRGCFVVNTTAELVPGDSELDRVLNQNQVDMQHLFTEYISTGIKKGEINRSKDPKAIAAMLFTLFNGLRVVAKINHDGDHLRKMVEVGLRVLD